MAAHRLIALVAAVLATVPIGPVGARTTGAPARPGAVVSGSWTVRDGVLGGEAGPVVAAAVRRLQDVLLTRPHDGRAVRTEILDAAAAGLGGAEPTAPAAVTGTPTQTVLYGFPVGDFDGDGRADVVTMRRTYEVAAPYFASTELVAHRGRDGAVLWRRSFPGAVHLKPGKVGPTGTPGLLVECLEFTPAAAPLYGETTRFLGIDDSGATAWERSFPSVAAYDASTLGLVEPAFTFAVDAYDAAPGPADDLLLTSVTVLGLVGQAQLIDGATGAIGPVGPPQLGAIPWPVPDLSGDGLGDAVFLGPEDLVSAYRAVDSHPLWVVRDELSMGTAAVWRAGDVSGDGLADLAVADYAAARFAVLSGADGAERWRGAGAFTVPLGDVDGNGRDDVVAVDFRNDQGVWGLGFRSYADDGRLLHASAHALALPQRYRGTGHFTISDVQRDGIADVTFGLALTDRDTGVRTTIGGGIDGATWEPLHSTPVSAPVRHALDGAGTDFVQALQDGADRLPILGVQGDTGSPLWKTTLRGPDAVESGLVPFDSIQDAEMTGDRCSDVVVSVVSGGEGSTVVVLDGGNGHLLWGEKLLADGTPDRVPAPTYGPDANRAC